MIASGTCILPRATQARARTLGSPWERSPMSSLVQTRFHADLTQKLNRIPIAIACHLRQQQTAAAAALYDQAVLTDAEIAGIIERFRPG